MRFYFRTRRTLAAVVAGTGIEAALLLLGRPLVIHHHSGVVTFTVATPLQILVVGALALGLSGRTEQFEFAGVRSLSGLRLVNACLLIFVGATASSAVSMLANAMSGEPVTVGVFAPLRASLGLFGVALGVITFTDMRLGALCALPLVFLPAAFDMRGTVVGETAGFVLADEQDAPWVSVCVLLTLGLILYVFGYSERASPSMNRRSIVDSRGRHRMKAVR